MAIFLFDPRHPGDLLRRGLTVGLLAALGLWAASPAVALSEAGFEASVAPVVITFGLDNRPGEAAVPTMLEDGHYEAGALQLQVQDGLLSLAQAPAVAALETLRHGDITLQIAARADHHCISTSTELEAVLAWPAAQKAGKTICMNPGRYGEIKWWPHRGAFMDMQHRNPITFQSTDPDRPAILDGFFIGSSGDTPGGNVVLRDLWFELTSPEVADLSDLGFRGRKHAIYLGWQGPPARNVLLENIFIRGPMQEAFKGGRPVEDVTMGVFIKGERITVRNLRAEQLMDAFHIQGRDIVIEHSRAHHLWGDMFQVSPEVGRAPEGHTGPPPCRRTARVVLRNNIMSDAWSNNVFHPDFIHMYASHRVPCGMSEVLIEGNIVYIGAEGARQPGFPTEFAATAPMAAPERLAFQPQVVQRLKPSSRPVILPPARCAEDKVMIGVQRVPGSGPLRLQPQQGDRMAVHTKPAPFHDMLGDWETGFLICQPKVNGQWDLRISKPGPQGIFSNAIPGPEGYDRVTVRYNVLWITSSNGVDLRDEHNTNILVTQNSFLQPFPGDANGDGRSNTHSDGFNELHASSQFHVNGRSFLVEGNISPSRLSMPATGWGKNDNGLRHNDGGRSMMARFTPDPRLGFMPTTPAQAIAMARPRRGGVLDGSTVGALGMTPEMDTYDWSWVPAE